MQSFVYASRRRADTYVWLRRRDQFDDLPDTLRETLGELRFVLEVDLTPEHRLPREDPAEILAHLDGRGWHLQVPPRQDTTDASRDDAI